MRVEERRIIEGFATNGQITAADICSVVDKMKEAAALIKEKQQKLVIANAETAAAIRKQFTREEVEIIITPSLENWTAYVVTDEELKKQLLETIKRRGY